MPFDRDDALKKGEKLLRQGRLEAAIAEYVRVVEEQPKDWTTANALGDLLVRAGLLEKACEQYARIAEHFSTEGFYPKAAALYKKILKLHPNDETVQLELAELAIRQGLLADAKAQMAAVAQKRRARGDRAGADDIVVRLGSLDPADFEARLNAARLVAQGGNAALAADRYRSIATDLFERNREAEALSALRNAVRLDPADIAGRTKLARAYLGMGEVASAREFLNVETAGNDPGLLIALAEVELREGHLEAANPLLIKLLDIESSMVNEVINIGWSFCVSNPEGAFLCIDRASDVALKHGDYQTAASILQEYVARATLQIPALLKLVEVCVDGGLESAMYETQGQLCDAYLAAGRAGEARVIAEDLVAREPWEQAHIERFRQALVQLKISDPDTIIAERLNGQVPFVATDHFAEDDLGPVMPLPEETPAHTGAGDVDVVALRSRLHDPEPADSTASAQGSEVDLTSALLSFDAPAAPAAPPTRSLDDVFARARDQASRQPGAEDAAEQLKLGKSYIEMGLLDDAVKALEQAARAPRQRFEAAAALGRLYRDRNQAPSAIEWMERAAEAPARSADEGRMLLYDLGATLEQAGENARALAVFLELLADAGSFRDVQARVDRLSRVETGS